MRTALDTHYADGKRLALEAIKLSRNPGACWRLSLQIMVWGIIPAWNRDQASPAELGQYQEGKLKGWRAEAVSVLADVQKLGWEELEQRNRNTRKKLKATITRRTNEWRRTTLTDRLSGKRRRLMKDIREAEKKIQTLERLEFRMKILRDLMPT